MLLDFPQPRFQALFPLPPFVIGRKTLFAAGHITTQNLCGNMRTLESKTQPSVWFYTVIEHLIKKGLHFFEQREMFKSVGCDWESLIVTEKVSIFFFPLWFDGCVKYGQSVVELIIWEFTCHCQRHSDTYDGHFFYWSLFVSLFFSILNLASYWRKESVHWSSSCSLQALSIVLAQVLWRNHFILWQWDFWGSSLSW